MPAIPIDMRPNSVFRQTGDMFQYGVPYVRNPHAKYDGKTYAARLFVGFNVGAKPKWKLDDLVELVQRERAQHEVAPADSPGDTQHVPPDATFFATRGLFTHDEDDEDPKLAGKTIREHGAQVVILSIFGEKKKQFRENMFALAETIAREMQQASVIVEFQRQGIIQSTHKVTP